jgi:hypothetical protein
MRKDERHGEIRVKSNAFSFRGSDIVPYVRSFVGPVICPTDKNMSRPFSVPLTLFLVPATLGTMDGRALNREYSMYYFFGLSETADR